MKPWQFTAVIGVPGALYAMKPDEAQECEAAKLCSCEDCQSLVKTYQQEQIEFLSARMMEGQRLT